jgi:hypothetical protein
MDRGYVNAAFFESCFSIDEAIILDMNKDSSDAGLSNVVVGLEDHCFGVVLLDDLAGVSYQMFYVNGIRGLRGFVLNMTLGNPCREDLVMMFSNHLASQYPELDSIDVFNTYQQFTRSMLEKIGYFTVTSLEMQKFEGKNSTIMAGGVRGISMISLIDKVQFLREYFGNRYSIRTKSDENYIYLMLNKRNGLIKIGTSINPRVREKTLQGEEPEVYMIAIWSAPKYIETELHKKFHNKRERGEWFKLKSGDMKQIKLRMTEFIQLNESPTDHTLRNEQYR